MTARSRPAYSFRGVHLAAGLLFPFAQSAGRDERVARERVVAAWEPGCEVYRLEPAGFALIWAEARRMDARYAPGALIVTHGGGYSAVPAKRGDPPPIAGALLIARAGELIDIPLEPSRRMDPSSWVEIGSFELLAPSAAAIDSRSGLAPPPSVRDVRQVLEDVPAPDPSLRAFQDAVAGRRQNAGRRLPWHHRLARWLESVSSGTLRLATGAQAPPRARKRAAGSRGSDTSTRRRRGPQDLLASWLRDSQIGRALGRRQAAYISRVLRMLDEGNVAEALRHAIPLGGDDAPWRGFSFGLPPPRGNLEIARNRAARGSLFAGGLAIFELLRTRYRALADRLIQEGRIDEAAFVLAELLDAVEEAVSLLERHGKLREAAEIAEGRKLPAALVVRQWFIAGDGDRAVAVARRTGAFSGAVARLHETHPHKADELRVVWADVLASSGEYAAAVEAIWPVEAARPLALSWIRLAIDLGGGVGARMLVRRALLEPGSVDEVTTAAGALLRSDTAEDLPARSALFRALLAEHDSGVDMPPQFGPLARAAVRATIRDVGLGWTSTSPRDYKRLARMAGEDLLLADMPSVVRKRRRARETDIGYAAHDTGSGSPTEFIRLASGRTLLAEGESGVRLLSRSGRVIKRFEVPADHLVIADNGTRALALAKRDTRWRVSYLQIDRLTSRDLGDLALDVWADSFDGAEWIVAEGTNLLAIDTLAAEPRASWQMSGLASEAIVSLARNEESLWVVVRGGALERWRYALPDLLLRAREPLPAASDLAPAAGNVEDASASAAISVSAEGDLLYRVAGGDARKRKPFTRPASGKRITVCLTGSEARFSGDRDHIAVAEIDPTGASVTLYRRPGFDRVLTISLEGARSVVPRLFAGHLSICDDLGRALAFDLATLERVCDLRL